MGLTGVGIGRSSIVNTSGPPALWMIAAFIVVGRDIMRMFWNQNFSEISWRWNSRRS